MSKIKTRAKIRFIDFLRPGSFPYPYTIEQALHVFRWMISTGAAYQKYMHSGVYELLSMKPTCINHNSVDSITSLDDLRCRFHWALLSAGDSPIVKEWKQDMGISIQGEKILVFPHYTPFENTQSEADIQKALKSLLNESRGTVLNVSLNDCHPKAQWVGGVRLKVCPEKFSFVIDYGYKNNTGWDYELAITKDNEPFTDTFNRAIRTMSKISVSRG
jgi:hypothetical protein